jgi:hypothetical protein
MYKNEYKYNLFPLLMVKFLKFSFIIINISHIKQIVIQNDKYSVHLSDINLQGSYNLFKVGNLQSDNSKIDIIKKIHPFDYDIMTNWINNNNDDH